MKKIFLGMAAIPLCAIFATSCVKESVETPADAATYLSYSAATGGLTAGAESRAAEVRNTTDLHDDRLVMQVYDKYNNVWIASNEVYWSVNKWVYNNGVSMIHPDEELVHYSVHPFEAELKGDEAAIEGHNATFDYEVPATHDQQQDLIVASANTSKTTSANTAQMTYRHVLSQVNFSVIGMAGADIRIKNIKIGGLKNKGTYTFANGAIGTWSNHDGTAEYDYIPEAETVSDEIQGGKLSSEYLNLDPGTTGGYDGEFFFGNHNANTIKDVDHANSLMLLPQSLVNNDEAFFSFDYQIFNTATGGDMKQGSMSPILLKGILINGQPPVWSPNKRYRYTIKFDTTNDAFIKLEYNASVSDWEPGNQGQHQVN